VKALLEKYAAKIERAGLSEPGAALLGGLDDSLVWNRPDPATSLLLPVFSGMNINSLLFAEPAEPHRSIISLLASEAGDAIGPADCETRTFLHDIPVVRDFDADGILTALRRRKSAVVRDRGVVAWGTVSPEQAFISYSSVCFSSYVKFFSDYLDRARRGTLTDRWREVFAIASGMLDHLPGKPPDLQEGPLVSEAGIRSAMEEAGSMTVELRLVDSFFGNLSYRMGGTLFISQTTSSLDELRGAVDACPLDGSACTGITASSEYSAHVGILRMTGADGVLHGHPRFSVIMSMVCDEAGCPARGSCHVRCPVERRAAGVPVVPGEVGTGPTGLCNTLPPAMVGRRGAIVYGHGLFTLARGDFNGALADMLGIERDCRREYFEAAAAASGAAIPGGL
jgi:ribulose-5-phosphate 4-epimerase/fuculose-1-phosphate aldolase